MRLGVAGNHSALSRCGRVELGANFIGRRLDHWADAAKPYVEPPELPRVDPGQFAAQNFDRQITVAIMKYLLGLKQRQIFAG